MKLLKPEVLSRTECMDQRLSIQTHRKRQTSIVTSAEFGGRLIVYTIGRLLFRDFIRLWLFFFFSPSFSLVFLTIRLASAFIGIIASHGTESYCYILFYFYFFDHGRPAGWFVGGQQASKSNQIRHSYILGRTDRRTDRHTRAERETAIPLLYSFFIEVGGEKMVRIEKDKSWNILFQCIFQLDISYIYIVVWEPFPFNSILNFNSSQQLYKSIRKDMT